MCAGVAHLGEQRSQPVRLGDDQRRSGDAPQHGGVPLLFGDHQQILDVHRPEQVVVALADDREARVSGLPGGVAEGGHVVVSVEEYHPGARNHDFVHTALRQLHGSGHESALVDRELTFGLGRHDDPGELFG
jgi:hypothetical protein